MGFIVRAITGKASKSAKTIANATLKAADDTAKNDRLIAQAAQQSRETMLAQDTAGRTASELLSRPQGRVDVSLASDATAAEIDPVTGRRRTARSTFTSKTRTAGIQI